MPGMPTLSMIACLVFPKLHLSYDASIACFALVLSSRSYECKARPREQEGRFEHTVAGEIVARPKTLGDPPPTLSSFEIVCETSTLG